MKTWFLFTLVMITSLPAFSDEVDKHLFTARGRHLLSAELTVIDKYIEDNGISAFLEKIDTSSIGARRNILRNNPVLARVVANPKISSTIADLNTGSQLDKKIRNPGVLKAGLVLAKKRVIMSTISDGYCELFDALILRYTKKSVLEIIQTKLASQAEGLVEKYPCLSNKLHEVGHYGEIYKKSYGDYSHPTALVCDPDKNVPLEVTWSSGEITKYFYHDKKSNLSEVISSRPAFGERKIRFDRSGKAIYDSVTANKKPSPSATIQNTLEVNFTQYEQLNQCCGDSKCEQKYSKQAAQGKGVRSNQ